MHGIMRWDYGYKVHLCDEGEVKREKVREGERGKGRGKGREEREEKGDGRGEKRERLGLGWL